MFAAVAAMPFHPLRSGYIVRVRRPAWFAAVGAWLRTLVDGLFVPPVVRAGRLGRPSTDLLDVPPPKPVVARSQVERHEAPIPSVVAPAKRAG